MRLRDGDGRALFMGSVDAVAAEIVSGSKALQEMLGENENLGQALIVLVDLFMGVSLPTAAPPWPRFPSNSRADELPQARIAIANRVIAELKNGRRLCPTSRLDELALLRKVGNRMVLGDARYLSHDNLVAALPCARAGSSPPKRSRNISPGSPR